TVVFVNATDASGNAADEQTFTVTVRNTVPVITGSLTAPDGPPPVGIPVTIYGEVRDNNIDSAAWHWSDGLVSPGTLLYDSSTVNYMISGQRIFDHPGTYTVELRVADHCGVTATHSYPQLFRVNGSGRGLAIGGGSIYSQKGAFTADASLTGIASF